MEAFSHERPPDRNQGAAHTVARGLGWFSIGLGLVESLMPQTMARAVGLQGKESLVRAFGLREIATGVGLLMTRNPEPWVWGRVAGDALDLGALTAGLRSDNPRRFGTAVAMLAVAQVAAVDVACAKALASHREQAENEWRYVEYRDRRGFDRPAHEMRGAALSDFSTPDDYRIPPALRPWEGQELLSTGSTSN